jgi:hypothetical protein
VSEFSVKERARFRKLLEVANSSTFQGERDAALAAATRLAATHGMSLREAAGMSDREKPAPPPKRRAAGFPSDFGAAAAGMRAAGLNRDPRARVYPRHGARATDPGEALQREEKRRHDAALADALKRGLDAEERAAAEKAAEKARNFYRRPNRAAFRNRAEFIRVLLRETHMSAKDIAATAGVTIYDVFREKLLMRSSSATG